MKKLFPLFIMIIFLLSACSIDAKTPVLPTAFNQRARVSIGDFSYQCEICKNEKGIIFTVLSTNAQGMVMTYDGSNMNFNFSDIIGDVPASSLPKTNVPIVLFEALSDLYEQDNLKPSAVNEGYRYQGKTSLGNFVLITDGSSRLKQFTLNGIDMKIEFE
ncbi:MAG: hypothetical protein J1E81_03100 [Eubacterium sp.]|nr:hypothetical protein [Eubacterium sp.]